MHRVAGLLLALLPGLAPAQAPPQRANFKYFTKLGDEVLNRVDAVLVGRIQSVTALRGTDVVLVEVVTWHSGPRRPDQKNVTLLANHGDFYVGTEQLLFLKLYEAGPRYTLHNRVARSDPDYDAKLHALEQSLALRRIPNEEDRKRQVRKQLWEDVGARDSWTRWHAYHELEWLRGRHDDLLPREDREELARLAARSGDPEFKKALTRLLKDWIQ